MMMAMMTRTIFLEVVSGRFSRATDVVAIGSTLVFFSSIGRIEKRQARETQGYPFTVFILAVLSMQRRYHRLFPPDSTMRETGWQTT